MTILLGPLKEIDLTPTREYRASRGSGALPRTSKPIVWNLIMEWQASVKSSEKLSNAVTLEPLSSLVVCQIIDQKSKSVDHLREIRFLVFQCAPSNTTISSEVSISNVDTVRGGIFSDLFLRVDFKGLTPLVNVYLAFTNNTQDILEMTRPTLLFPGMNLMGVVNLIVRKRFRTPELSAFGLFDVYDTFAIADVVSTASMSGTASPKDISPSVSTLHVTYQGPPGEWRVIEDYREKSVLNGVSAAGGLGAFFSLLCAVLFGTSLFSVLFRTKPLSAFGILHGLESQQKELGRVCKSKYPKLESELRALETEENRGVLALLLDTLLDLDLIKEQLTKPEFSTACSDTDGGGDGDSSMEEEKILGTEDDKLLGMHTLPGDFPKTAGYSEEDA